MSEKAGPFASTRILLGVLALVLVLIVAALTGYYFMKLIYRASEMRGARLERPVGLTTPASKSAGGSWRIAGHELG